MKRLYTLLIACVLMATSANQIKAQETPGEIAVTAGVGYGLISAIFNVVPDVKLVPPTNLMVDVGVVDEFSLGVAYTYMGASYSEDFLDPFTGFGETVDFRLSRQNFGLRPLYHYSVDKANMDGYVGGRVGYTIWSAKDNSILGNSTSVNFGNGNVSFQAIWGFRAYFTDFLGFNFELGLGTAPYAIAGGFTAKF